MSTHYRSSNYSGKEPQSKSIYTYEDDYHPSKHEHRLFRNKNNIVDYEGNDYRNYEEDDKLGRKSSQLGNSRRSKKDDNNDVDWLYCKSKEKFASWDIKDLEDERDSPDKRSPNSKAPYDRKNSRDFVDVEVEEIFVNGDSSPRSKRNGSSHQEQGRSSSGNRRERAFKSPSRKNGNSYVGKSSEAWSEEEEEEVPHLRSYDRGGAPLKTTNNRNQLLREIETFGSLKKRNEKNSGLNLGFRALVDKFRTKSDDKDKKEIIQKNKKPEMPGEDWRHGNGYKDRRSPEKLENYPPAKESKTEKNHRIKDHEFDREVRPRIRSPSIEDDPCYSTSNHQDSDGSKRRSYAFEASPEDFDVRIQKYERARADDPEIYRRNSFQDRGHRDSGNSQRFSRERIPKNPDVIRKSSLRGGKDQEGSRRCESSKAKASKSKVSERHSRPLTPPINQQVQALEHFRDESSNYSADPPRKTFSMKEWYESNRQFAAKYLKEHSKVKELSTSDVSAKDEFVFGSPKDSRTYFEIENRESHRHRRESFEDDYSRLQNDEDKERGSSYRGYSSVGHAEVPTVVKLRTSVQEDSMKRRTARTRVADEAANGRRRRHRRESLDDEEEEGAEEEEEDEDEDEDEAISRRSDSYARSFVMPTRKIWNYRDGV